jgi:tetratricopeptide (TPR) repeat protein
VHWVPSGAGALGAHAHAASALSAPPPSAPAPRAPAPSAPQAPAPSAPNAPSAPSALELRKRAFDLAYNLDHDEAIALLERAKAIAPDDPASYRSIAAITWFQSLFRRGAVTVDHYLGSVSRPRVDLRKPDPQLDRQFKAHVERAIALAAQRVAARPRDAQAHYDHGSALGLRASYTASVEGRLLAGFRAAKAAFDAHERVIQLDPRRKDAGLVVGTYRYVVSTLSLPVRWMAYVVGFGGGRERGLRMVEAAAAYPGESRIEARFALILLYNRERNYEAALRVIESMEREFPRNRLMLLEKGATALRAGRYAEAERALSDGLGRLARETRPRMLGEEALWRYKRGAARLGAGRTDAAIGDLRAALAAGAADWIAGRTRLELGKVADLAGDREGARREYRQAIALCERDHDPLCVDAGRRLVERPYKPGARQ